MRQVVALSLNNQVLCLFTNKLAGYNALRSKLADTDRERLPSYPTINRKLRHVGNSYLCPSLVGVYELRFLRVAKSFKAQD